MPINFGMNFTPRMIATHRIMAAPNAVTTEPPETNSPARFTADGKTV